MLDGAVKRETKGDTLSSGVVDVKKPRSIPPRAGSGSYSFDEKKLNLSKLTRSLEDDVERKESMGRSSMDSSYNDESQEVDRIDYDADSKKKKTKKDKKSSRSAKKGLIYRWKHSRASGSVKKRSGDAGSRMTDDGNQRTALENLLVKLKHKLGMLKNAVSERRYKHERDVSGSRSKNSKNAVVKINGKTPGVESKQNAKDNTTEFVAEIPSVGSSRSLSGRVKNKVKKEQWTTRLPQKSTFENSEKSPTVNAGGYFRSTSVRGKL
jgi:hypothetical protein